MTGQTETITGQTNTERVKPTMNGHIDDMGILYAIVDTIEDSFYDEEMDRYNFIIRTFAGDIISVGLKERLIKEMSLYVNKEQAEQRYFNHIQKSF